MHHQVQKTWKQYVQNLRYCVFHRNWAAVSSGLVHSTAPRRRWQYTIINHQYRGSPVISSLNNRCCAAFIMTSLYILSLSTPPSDWLPASLQPVPRGCPLPRQSRSTIAVNNPFLPHVAVQSTSDWCGSGGTRDVGEPNAVVWDS